MNRPQTDVRPEPARVGLPWHVSDDDHARQVDLTAMKRRATGLLAMSAGVFLVATLLDARYPWLLYVRATAEAAMVGGIADWFAVTALFRHPLGLPIPHTAIIPARKDRIGHSLGAFVQNNFLSRDVVSARLSALRPGERTARWLCRPENSALVARHLAAGLAGPLRVLRDEDVQQILERSLASWIGSVRVAPVLGKILWLFTAGDRHQDLLDVALRAAARFVTQNEELIRERIRNESPWWIPERIDARIHEKIVRGIATTLQQISEDPNHPLRVRYDGAFRELIDRLQASAELGERLEKLKAELVQQAAVRQFSASVWRDLKGRLLRFAEGKDEWAPGAIQRGMSAVAAAVLSDPALLAKIETWLQDAVLYAVEQYRGEVQQFISHTVSQWDAGATSQKIELQVGRDLQFLRINGTLVGGIVGLALQVLSSFL
ncbi:MAG: DUF445 domain-containing protein [Deltaproteobacteria bacterium]|nr:DUF445 domain-containing protein [Deltaproteobacteria bacterium]